MTRKANEANFFVEKYATVRDSTLFEKDLQAQEAMLFCRRMPSSALFSCVRSVSVQTKCVSMLFMKFGSGLTYYVGTKYPKICFSNVQILLLGAGFEPATYGYLLFNIYSPPDIYS